MSYTIYKKTKKQWTKDTSAADLDAALSIVKAKPAPTDRLIKLTIGKPPAKLPLDADGVTVPATPELPTTEPTKANTSDTLHVGDFEKYQRAKNIVQSHLADLSDDGRQKVKEHNERHGGTLKRTVPIRPSWQRIFADMVEDKEAARQALERASVTHKLFWSTIERDLESTNYMRLSDDGEAIEEYEGGQS